MKRSYYSNTIKDFKGESNSKILGKLNTEYNLESLNIKQKNSWIKQIEILKKGLIDFEKGHIFFEFSIPRMGKRADNIIILNDHVIVVEFKVGSNSFDAQSIDQVIDYSLDLKHFHEGSHSIKIVPILLATNADFYDDSLCINGEIYNPIKSNEEGFSHILNRIYLNSSIDNSIVPVTWETSKYKPTPTIIEAAQALYQGHNVKDITRYEAGENNLFTTSQCLNKIIDETKFTQSKSICFVTGVPGAGKTLVGLNIVNERKNIAEDENAVFLSGNGPLVDVLREALARDRSLTAKKKGEKLKIDDARREVNSSIQNIHHFRDEYFRSKTSPNEKVVVFDEAQRAWNQDKTGKFIKEKHGKVNFQMSEPECLIDFMNRHEGWCSVICLIGGGQEINTGEAGIEEWLRAIKNRFNHWNIYYSRAIVQTRNYVNNSNLVNWLKPFGTEELDLHLGVSVRSFRSEKLAELVESILHFEIEKAKALYELIQNNYPIFITRNLSKAKSWLVKKQQGTERSGILVSSSAKRLRALGVDAEYGLRSNSGKNKIASWFLNYKGDVRSSTFLEIPATQFAVQGLELDWVCLAWGGDFYFDNEKWIHRNFIGTKWNNIGKIDKKEYLKNTYRVLLTRARQGMIIFIPEGNNKDKTRQDLFYDGTYRYLKSIGIKEI